ncbi:MAG: carboxy terminal-processing peptidase, partial [Bacteroidota bacterium]|nr:carboxy terminal-processing peptidase [Bacteroidota bacterium]
VQGSEVFKLIKENTEWLAKQNDKEYSLQLDNYRKDQKAIRNTVTQLQQLLKLDNEMNVTSLQQEANKYANDKDKQDRFANWIKNLRKDIYLDQAVKTVNDMIQQRNIALGTKKNEPAKKAF